MLPFLSCQLQLTSIHGKKPQDRIVGMAMVKFIAVDQAYFLHLPAYMHISATDNQST